MKTQIAFLLAPLALLSGREELRLHVEPGTTLTKTFENRMEVSLDEMSMTVGDQEVPPDHFVGVDISKTETRTVVFVDEYLEMGDGMPAKLRRTFEELSNQSTESASNPQGDSEKTSEETSKLEGTSVVFAWDEDAGEYTVEFDDEDGDEDLLEELEEDTDLLAFLPEGDVDEGDTWEIDASLMTLLLRPGGELSFLDEDGESSDSELGDELEENVEGDVTATFEGLTEIDGRTLALIRIEADLTTEGDEERENEAGVMETHSAAFAMVLEGELRWDLEAGHAAGFELSGDVEVDMTVEGSFGDQESRQELRLSGSTTLTLEVEADD